MEKKNYAKPTMTVVELKHRMHLLQASIPDGGGGGYIPGMGSNELNKLA